MTAPLDAPADPALANLALDDFDVSDPKLYQDDVWQPYFARLRREDPVHYCRQSLYGPYWSVTKYKDIMQVEVNHQVYSSASELGGIAVEDQPKDMDRPSFIRMDPPKHDEQRMVVSLGFGAIVLLILGLMVFTDLGKSPEAPDELNVPVARPIQREKHIDGVMLRRQAVPKPAAPAH